MSTSKHRILVALVENKTGVLNRVSSLFRRRKFNIRSLTVGETEREGISRMTIVVDSAKTNVDQVIKQMYKIINVLKVSDITNDHCVKRELALIKVFAKKESRAEIMQIVDIFRAKIVDVAAESLMIETTGNTKKIDSLLGLVRKFGIKEMVRTGITAMNRGVSGEVKLRKKD